MREIWKVVALLGIPAALSGQETPADARAAVDALLDAPAVDSLLTSLEERFVGHFMILVPELPDEEREVLRAAARDAFTVTSLKSDVADAVVTGLDDGTLREVLAMHRSGPIVELRRVAEGFEPEESLDAFLADPGGIDRPRLQLMASLREAMGTGERALIVDEALRGVAHQVVEAAGGALGAFEPLADETFDAAYRDRILSEALESLHALKPASDELLGSAIEAYRSDAARRYGDALLSGLVAAVGAAGQRFVERTVAAPPPPPEPNGPSGGPCVAVTCGYIVQWDGAEPQGNSPAYGSPGDLDRLVLSHLAAAGFSLVRGSADDAPTLRLRPRASRAYCEVVSGTNNRVCLAVGQVRVEFLGPWGTGGRPNAFTVVNRCRANEALSVAGISALVASRIAHELTTYPGDERTQPRC